MIIHREIICKNIPKPLIDIFVKKIPFNYLGGLMAKPERIYIDIKHKDFQKMEYRAMLALENRTLYGIENKYLRAVIRYKEKIIPIKIRLKGGMAEDHLGGKRRSLRVKLEGKHTLFRIKRFSLMDPRQRNFLLEWFLREVMRKEGIISKRYKFVEVVINGKDMGIYALDEHYDKTMLEYNQRREGPIIHLSREHFFYEKAAWCITESQMDDYYFSMDISVYDDKKIMSDGTLFKQFIKARNLYDSFRRGILSASEVFDMAKLAKWMAITDVLGAWHGCSFIDMVFYYNPITSKIEPIPDDNYDGSFAVDPGNKLFRLNDKYSKGKFLKDLFSDLTFTEMYIRELERVSKKSYLDDILRDLNEEIKKNSAMIYKNVPYYKFPVEQLYKNQESIREILNPYKGIQAYFDERSASGIRLKIANNKIIPMEILYTIYKEDIIFKPTKKRIILKGKEEASPVHYEDIEFNMPNKFVWEDNMVSGSVVVYRLLGTSKLREVPIFLYPAFNEQLFKKDSIRKPSNFKDFLFLKVDPINKKEIRIQQGKWVLSQNLVIPEGYALICEAGAELNLINSASILSYSPMIFIGSEGQPILITSADSTGQGIAVLNSPKKSIFENVVFRNLSPPSQSGWKLTGAVTLYESPVYFYQCQFSQNIKGDDFLNIIRSKFTIDKSVFREIFADALDIDFSDGKIFNSSFLNCGSGDESGDGIDISGSVVEISNVFINGISDKGLSVGENSSVSAKQIKVINSNIAVAGKDMSDLSIEDIAISDSKNGFAVFQKKPEFGPAKITINSFKGENIKTLHLIEEGSILVINGAIINGTEKDLAKLLYDKDD